MEEAAIEKLDNLIVESQASNLFEFDEQTHIVSFPATTKKGTTRTVSHRLRKPTLKELNERESLIKQETVRINSHEVEVRSDSKTADARLWEGIVDAVRGYDGSEEWQQLGDESKAKFNSSHKIDAINLLYAGSSEIDGDGDYVPIGPSDWTVKQEIGPNKEEPDFVVYHVLREPTEEERQRYDRGKSSTAYVAGARKEEARVRTYLKGAIELYDALIQDIKGGTVAGETLSLSNRKPFLAAIDPIWKRDVVQTLMSALEAQLSD